MKFHRKRETCRLCDSKNLELVIHLNPIPAADRYVSADQKGKPQELYPLDLYLCLTCGHAQLLDVVEASELFRDYLYMTSTSLGLVEHFKNYANEVCSAFPFAKDSRVVEIGSNEGVLLNFFKQKGFRVLGVDPAKQIAEKATGAGLETWPEFFTKAIAEKIRNERGAAAIVAANNVFAHNDDLAGMADGVRLLLQPDGIFVFEANYLGDLVEKKLFDIIYHEHLSYHSVKPLQSFLARHGLELIHVKRVPTKVGSIRCVAQLANGPRKRDQSVDALLAFEKERKLDRPETFRALDRELQKMRARMNELIAGLKKEGKKIAGYGAAPSSTTLIYFFGLQPVMDFIVDDNPLKQGRFSPGCHLPVIPSDNLVKLKPDYVIVLAWPYIHTIVERNKIYRDQGGKFIVPLPDVSVI